jgi:hypothetical protein
MLPSIDKTNRNPAPPKGEHVRKLDPSELLHPRDYAYELEHVLERDHHRPKQDHDFGEDTFEPSDNSEQEQTPARNKNSTKDTTNPSDHDSNIDITV